MEPSGKPKAKSKPKKEKKLPAVELPRVDDTPFVPPVAVRDRGCGSLPFLPNLLSSYTAAICTLRSVEVSW